MRHAASMRRDERIPDSRRRSTPPASSPGHTPGARRRRSDGGHRTPSCRPLPPRRARTTPGDPPAANPACSAATRTTGPDPAHCSYTPYQQLYDNHHTGITHSPICGDIRHNRPSGPTTTRRTRTDPETHFDAASWACFFATGREKRTQKAHRAGEPVSRGGDSRLERLRFAPAANWDRGGAAANIRSTSSSPTRSPASLKPTTSN